MPLLQTLLTLLTLLATTVPLALASTSTTTPPSTITTPPHPLRARQTSAGTFDANIAACSSFSSLSASCAAVTPSFAALPFATEASCLCYTDASTYAPSIYDGYWGSCLNYYQTASPDFYSQSLDGDALMRTPCGAAGNVLGSGAATGVVSSVVAGGMTSNSAAASATASSGAGQATGTSVGVRGVERGGAAAAAGVVLVGLAVMNAVL